MGLSRTPFTSKFHFHGTFSINLGSRIYPKYSPPFYRILIFNKSVLLSLNVYKIAGRVAVKLYVQTLIRRRVLWQLIWFVFPNTWSKYANLILKINQLKSLRNHPRSDPEE